MVIVVTEFEANVKSAIILVKFGCQFRFKGIRLVVLAAVFTAVNAPDSSSTMAIGLVGTKAARLMTAVSGEPLRFTTFSTKILPFVLHSALTSRSLFGSATLLQTSTGW